MSNVNVLVKNVGEKAEILEIENTLEEMKKIVGGYVEMVSLPENIILWCNEEGKLDNLPLNLIIRTDDYIADYLHGNIFFSSFDGAEISSLSQSQQFWIQSRLAEFGISKGRMIYSLNI